MGYVRYECKESALGYGIRYEIESTGNEILEAMNNRKANIDNSVYWMLWSEMECTRNSLINIWQDSKKMFYYLSDLIKEGVVELTDKVQEELKGMEEHLDSLATRINELTDTLNLIQHGKMPYCKTVIDGKIVGEFEYNLLKDGVPAENIVPNATKTWFVSYTSKSMSGWGTCLHKENRVLIACDSEIEAQIVKQRVASNSDSKYPSISYGMPVPQHDKYYYSLYTKANNPQAWWYTGLEEIAINVD